MTLIHTWTDPFKCKTCHQRSKLGRFNQEQPRRMPEYKKIGKWEGYHDGETSPLNLCIAFFIDCRGKSL